jgi:hypothetical protein
LVVKTPRSYTDPTWETEVGCPQMRGVCRQRWQRPCQAVENPLVPPSVHQKTYTPCYSLHAAEAADPGRLYANSLSIKSRFLGRSQLYSGITRQRRLLRVRVWRDWDGLIRVVVAVVRAGAQSLGYIPSPGGSEIICQTRWATATLGLGLLFLIAWERLSCRLSSTCQWLGRRCSTRACWQSSGARTSRQRQLATRIATFTATATGY